MLLHILSCYLRFILCLIVCLLLIFVMVTVVCLLFFFKQKTAYEMRISDWSSDVCSSDLHPPGAEPAGGRGAGGKPARRRHPGHRSQHLCLEIGRASSRERVCQYV